MAQITVPSQVTIANTVTPILAPSGFRRAFFLKALQSNQEPVFLKFDNSTGALTAANGWPLYPGESLVIGTEVIPDGRDLAYAVKGIAAGTTNPVIAQVEL